MTRKNITTFIFYPKKYRGTLYVGVTSNLILRILEHRLKVKKGFSEKYDLFRLVYYETFEYVDAAIQREKQVKRWNRNWKIRQIETVNTEWRDLLPEIADKEQIEYLMDLIDERKDFYEN